MSRTTVCCASASGNAGFSGRRADGDRHVLIGVGAAVVRQHADHERAGRAERHAHRKPCRRPEASAAPIPASRASR